MTWDRRTARSQAESRLGSLKIDGKTRVKIQVTQLLSKPSSCVTSKMEDFTLPGKSEAETSGPEGSTSKSGDTKEEELRISLWNLHYLFGTFRLIPDNK